MQALTTKETPVLDSSGNETGNTLPLGTRVRMGLMYQGSFDESGNPLPGFRTLRECVVEATGEEVWIDESNLNSDLI